MLAKIFKYIRRHRDQNLIDQLNGLESINKLRLKGDNHAAITAYKDYLKSDPYNVEGLNNLGVCLSETGDDAEARVAFELAYSLDDSYIPGVVNYAKTFVDRRRSAEAVPFLRQVWSCDPGFSGVYSVYAGLCLTRGEVVKARALQLRAWLSNFDSMRNANNYLFISAYDDLDESVLAAEHLFWAETQRPLGLAAYVEDRKNKKIAADSASSFNAKSSSQEFKKIRIGYWSPDFRNHSVRYFFRPLVENHDHERFEIFLYHDIHAQDAQTDAIKKNGDHFHDVYTLSDADLYDLIKSHQLDILVELAGHTSANRISVLQENLAKLQITALGYPPTTGMKTVNAKILDRHVVTPRSAEFYSELPLALPNSFWCFDPSEDVPIKMELAFDRNKHITFGCVGNIGKINERILKCWKTILGSVPGSRLLIRSISFEDLSAQDSMRAWLVKEGFDIDMIDLRKPEGGSAYFKSYEEIDIILDTFPFNGGTTTCFATYMGVPVVSLFGESLISRMGLSILSNLEVPELAVSDEAAYVECAIKMAGDISFLRKFRREVRARFQQSSIGNGAIFAKDFEEACVNLINQKNSGELNYQHSIAPLPSAEIMRRAHEVLRAGQRESATRIVNHCFWHYPDHGMAHVFVAQQMALEQRYEEALNHLLTRLKGFTSAEQIAALISISRWYLVLGRRDQALNMVQRLQSMDLEKSWDSMQAQLFSACVSKGVLPEPKKATNRQAARIRVLIPCDEGSRFDAMRAHFEKNCVHPSTWEISYERCDETLRSAAYTSTLQLPDIDIVVIVQKNIDIHNPDFFLEVFDALQSCDVLGMSGAVRWNRMHWRGDAFDCKAGSFFMASAEKPGAVEIHLLGTRSEVLMKDMAILDGSLLAVAAAKLRNVAFDDELSDAEWLMEENWTHVAARSGLHLGVHRNLGVFVSPVLGKSISDRATGRMKILDEYGFDPFSIVGDDAAIVSAPASDVREARRIMHNFWTV